MTIKMAKEVLRSTFEVIPGIFTTAIIVAVPLYILRHHIPMFDDLRMWWDDFLWSFGPIAYYTYMTITSSIPIALLGYYVWKNGFWNTLRKAWPPIIPFYNSPKPRSL